MSENGVKFSAKDLYSLMGSIYKEFYKEFGEKAIPVIERICTGMGTSGGKELKAERNLPSMDVKSAAVYLGNYFRDEVGLVEDPKEVEVKSPKEVHWIVTDCSPGYKPGDHKVCIATMKGDEAMINALCDGKAKLTVKKAIAFGDEACVVVITEN